jgi:hypothetical protein
MTDSHFSIGLKTTCSFKRFFQNYKHRNRSIDHNGGEAADNGIRALNTEAVAKPKDNIYDVVRTCYMEPDIKPKIISGKELVGIRYFKLPKITQYQKPSLSSVNIFKSTKTNHSPDKTCSKYNITDGGCVNTYLVTNKVNTTSLYI